MKWSHGCDHGFHGRTAPDVVGDSCPIKIIKLEGISQNGWLARLLLPLEINQEIFVIYDEDIFTLLREAHNSHTFPEFHKWAMLLGLLD